MRTVSYNAGQPLQRSHVCHDCQVDFLTSHRGRQELFAFFSLLFLLLSSAQRGERLGKEPARYRRRPAPQPRPRTAP